MKLIPLKDAIEYFKAKTALAASEFAALVEEIGEYAKSQAFTVARVARADVLQDLHGEILKAIEAGQTIGEFRAGIDKIMVRRGWEGLNPYRLDNIFRTNVQTAYNVGRYKQMKRVTARRPYWQYDAVNDSNSRPSHLVHDEIVYRHDHPFWQTWHPPNGYRCFPPWINVLTRSGWKEISAILPEDRIIGGSGKEQCVTAVHRNMFNGNIIRLIFEDGRIEATPNHRILTMRGWVRANELHRGDILVETIPLAPVDAFVCDEYMADPQFGNSGMTSPVKREPTIAFAAYGEVQGRNETVQPSGADGSQNNMIMEHFQSKTPDIFEHYGLRSGRGHFACDMLKGFSPDHESMGFGILCTNFRPSGGSSLLESFSNSFSPMICFLGVAEMPMETAFFALQIEASQLIGGILATLDGGMYPLGLDGIATLAGRDAKMPNNSDQGMIGNLPTSAERSVGQFFFNVEQIQGISNGAPLNSFDSMDSFRAWAKSHSVLRKIITIQKIPYTGTVVNLSVETDESYIIQGATVHNCRCKVHSLSVIEMGEEGLKAETKDTVLEPDEGFEHNPAEQEWKPDTGKYSPKLRKQLKEALKIDN